MDNLLPPYNENEIIEFEKKTNTIIPIILREYLLNISRETRSFYSHVIELKIDLSCYLNENGQNESESDSQSQSESKSNSQSESESESDSEIAYDDKKSYFIKINEKGCNIGDFLCIKGPFYGYIGKFPYTWEFGIGYESPPNQPYEPECFYIINDNIKYYFESTHDDYYPKEIWPEWYVFKN